MDLFDQQDARNDNRPLADRMRPRNLDEYVGQDHLLGADSLLRRAVQEDRLFSVIFWGPPGSGKTTLARILAGETKSHFVSFSAVLSGVKEIRAVVDEAAEQWPLHRRRTLLFVDEIHRFNKAQQDAVLHAVEDGVVTLIGATTENPYFEVNSALLSRCQLYRLEPLPAEQVGTLVRTALADEERGLGAFGVTLEDGGEAFLAEVSRGDARVAFNALETAWRSRAPRAGGGVMLSVADLRDAAQKSPVAYDREDAHYDTISAFIKSLRGSDPDAAVYYVASMLAGGEDPKFIARRMIVFASEDVGNADPTALQVAVAASRAVEFVGLPECRINLSQAAVYLALAPKSNASYLAIDAAEADVRREGNQPPPPHLRDASYRGAKELGHGKGYKYPHSYGGWVAQHYLPERLAGRRYYTAQRGVEAEMARRLQEVRGAGSTLRPPDGAGARPDESDEGGES